MGRSATERNRLHLVTDEANYNSVLQHPARTTSEIRMSNSWHGGQGTAGAEPCTNTSRIGAQPPLSFDEDLQRGERTTRRIRVVSPPPRCLTVLRSHMSPHERSLSRRPVPAGTVLPWRGRCEARWVPARPSPPGSAVSPRLTLSAAPHSACPLPGRSGRARLTPAGSRGKRYSRSSVRAAQAGGRGRGAGFSRTSPTRRYLPP